MSLGSLNMGESSYPQPERREVPMVLLGDTLYPEAEVKQAEQLLAMSEGREELPADVGYGGKVISVLKNLPNVREMTSRVVSSPDKKLPEHKTFAEWMHDAGTVVRHIGVALRRKLGDLLQG